MKQLTAFEKYLLHMPMNKSVDHVLECLKSGEMNNAAWDMMAKINGVNWTCEPEKMRELIANSLNSLAQNASGKQ